MSRNPPRNAALTWLPYNLLEIVISTASSSKHLNPVAHNQLRDLQSELSNRIKGMQKFSNSSAIGAIPAGASN